MSCLVIVHFQPVEKYPPVVNFIRFVQQQQDYKRNLHVITTHPGDGKSLIDFPDVQVHRVEKWKNRGRVQRLLFYVFFNIKSLWILLKYKPGKVFYYETLSAFGPWGYKKLINKKSELYIHYHEYTSVQEYQAGMALSRWLHKKERQLYPLATWISHTNEDRMNFFLKDIGAALSLRTHILPNYPFSTWKEKASTVKNTGDQRIGFVYVGALSMQTMHTQQMAEFVAAHPETCYWDIYSDNHTTKAIDFLKALNAPNIFFKGAIAYDELPLVLPKYDIGVMLYTGDTPNYEYNAPNKFFEYYICGLNIWFGKGMKGMYHYQVANKKPWVQCVDFNELELPEGNAGLRVETVPQPIYTAENIYLVLWDRLKN
jgi:hypothetical protein